MMARSVGVHPRSVAIVYIHVSPTSPDDPGYSDYEDDPAWDSLIDDIRYCLSERFPSLGDADGWEGREGQIVLDNSHAKVVVYAYGAVVSVCLVPKNQHIGRAWARTATKGFRQALEDSGFWVLRLIGMFSNGEAVYERSNPLGPA